MTMLARVDLEDAMMVIRRSRVGGGQRERGDSRCHLNLRGEAVVTPGLRVWVVENAMDRTGYGGLISGHSDPARIVMHA
jgi:hypothetical protein